MKERFSASVAGRHMACHASADLGSAIPLWTPPLVPSGKAANRGTNAHSIFEKIWEYSAKEIESFAKTLDFVAKIRMRRRFKVLIEETVEAKWLKTKPKTTADLVLYVNDEIHIIDTKWGKVLVECFENTQLLYYAVCYAPLAPKAKGVWVHIAQPNADNFDSWFIPTDRLKKFMEDAIATEAAIEAGDLSFGPSDYCTFCPANPHSRSPKGKPSCPAMTKLLYPRIEVDEDEILNG